MIKNQIFFAPASQSQQNEHISLFFSMHNHKKISWGKNVTQLCTQPLICVIHRSKRFCRQSRKLDVQPKQTRLKIVRYLNYCRRYDGDAVQCKRDVRHVHRGHCRIVTTNQYSLLCRATIFTLQDMSQFMIWNTKGRSLLLLCFKVAVS